MARPDDSRDWRKDVALTVSIIALIVSALSLVLQNLWAIHDLRGGIVKFDHRGDSVFVDVLLANWGKRTESVLEIRLIMADSLSRGGGSLGANAGPLILKPGEAQLVPLRGNVNLDELRELGTIPATASAVDIGVSFAYITQGGAGERVVEFTELRFKDEGSISASPQVVRRHPLERLH